MKYTWKKTDDRATDNLGLQMQKIVRNMNENKFNTRWRYIAAQKRFISFTAKEFRLQKLSNVKDTHLEKYVASLKNQGNSDKYIKNELSAIRFFHNHTMGTKYELSDSTKFNKMVGLVSTPDGKIDRAWSEVEIQKMQEKAIQLNKGEIVTVIDTVRATGMRIDEVCNIKHHHINNALKNGFLRLEGGITKGGVPRDIPLTLRAKSIFKTVIGNVERGSYVFTPKEYTSNHTIHKFEKSIQNFIGYHRNSIQNEDRSISGHNVFNSKGALTVHGLRHSFAREQYFTLKELGMNSHQARVEVSHMLGHGRDSVTFIYLGSIE